MQKANPKVKSLLLSQTDIDSLRRIDLDKEKLLYSNINKLNNLSHVKYIFTTTTQDVLNVLLIIQSSLDHCCNYTYLVKNKINGMRLYFILDILSKYKIIHYDDTRHIRYYQKSFSNSTANIEKTFLTEYVNIDNDLTFHCGMVSKTRGKYVIDSMKYVDVNNMFNEDYYKLLKSRYQDLASRDIMFQHELNKEIYNCGRRLSADKMIEYIFKKYHFDAYPLTKAKITSLSDDELFNMFRCFIQSL